MPERFIETPSRLVLERDHRVGIALDELEIGPDVRRIAVDDRLENLDRLGKMPQIEKLDPRVEESVAVLRPRSP